MTPRVYIGKYKGMGLLLSMTFKGRRLIYANGCGAIKMCYWTNSGLRCG